MGKLFVYLKNWYQYVFPFARLYSDLTKAREDVARLEAENEANTSFLSMFSHDFRTPMNAIIGMVELSKEEIKNDNYFDVMTNLSHIEESADYMLSMLGSILDSFKLEKNKLVLSYEAFNLNLLIKGVSSMLNYTAARKGINLIIKKHLFNNTDILGDKTRVKQILVNLISNAIKFTENGGCVLLEVYQELLSDNMLLATINVSDNGIGMSDEFMDKLFMPFEQEDRGLHHTHNDGTGLGLSICQQFVSLMNGTIDVSSELNVGSRFSVKIPFEFIKIVPKKKETVSTRSDKYDFSGKRVLLVDDNLANLEITQKQLEYVHLEAETAENGEKAVKMFLNSPTNYYDLIIMDVQMPVKNGLEATKEIRRLDHPDATTVKIIAMTANTFGDDIQLCYDAGMDMHISKPVKMNTLFEMLDKIFNVDN